MSVRSLVANVQVLVRFQSVLGRRYFNSNSKDIIPESVDEEPVFLSDTKHMDAKRNKSRLTVAHRNILQGQKPYDQSMAWFHNTVKYKRRILGRYGMEALGVSAGLAWPTPKEVENFKEYERVAYPLTIQETWKNIAEEKKRKEEDIIARQNKIAAKMVNMENLIATVKMRIAKKQLEADEARFKKQKRLDEIRKQLRLMGQMTSDKVNEMLEKYEKEEKKKKKEAKKQKRLERQQKYLASNMPIETSEEKGSSENIEESPAAETTQKT